MKKRKMFLGLGLILTLLITSVSHTHLVNVEAEKDRKVLDGVVVVLDAGHGGKDDGARCENEKEQDINLSIVKKLQKQLQTKGAEVILTRDGKYDLASANASNRKREDMKKRMEIINADKVDVFLSVHLNSYPNNSVHGAQAFYQKGNAVSETFAKLIQKHFKVLTQTKMSAKPGDYYLLNNAKKIGSLVECGFLSNPEDRSNLKSPSYQEKVAQCLCNSIVEYFDFLL